MDSITDQFKLLVLLVHPDAILQSKKREHPSIKYDREYRIYDYVQDIVLSVKFYNQNLAWEDAYNSIILDNYPKYQQIRSGAFDKYDWVTNDFYN